MFPTYSSLEYVRERSEELTTSGQVHAPHKALERKESISLKSYLKYYHPIKLKIPFYAGSGFFFMAYVFRKNKLQHINNGVYHHCVSRDFSTFGSLAKRRK